MKEQLPELYYRFCDEEKEVRVLRHDTPTPWMNYLSNGSFHAMVSQAGGGVAFYRSPQIWRVNHYRFFHLPTDRSGFYTYIKHGGGVWCPTAEPTPQKPEEWQAAHGLGYTRFAAKRGGVQAVVNYFIPPDEDVMVWDMALEAEEDTGVTVFPFVELGMMEFMRELQWQCYNKHQLSVEWDSKTQALVYNYGVEMQPKPDETPLVYFACDREVKAFDGDRDEFVGAYRSEENPWAIGEGGCTNSQLKGGDPCFALEVPLRLEKGKPQHLRVFLGVANSAAAIGPALAKYRAQGFAEAALRAIKQNWNSYLAKTQCRLPDADAQRMVNIWNPYQAQRNFLFSRNLSYYATGTFRGVGYRDTAQDILAIVPLDLEAAKEKTRLLLGQQYADGHANHYFFPVEGYPPVTSVHSDDHLWIILTVSAIVQEEGSTAFLREQAPYYDEGAATVWQHLKQAVAFTAGNMGQNGFPLMLRSDWNDMLYKVCREGRGESIWTAMQLGTALCCMARLAPLMEESPEEYTQTYARQKQLVNTIGWDGEWYRRCITDDGTFIGSSAQPQAKIWLNTQSWAVMSGMAEGGKARTAMDSVHRLLNTPLGIKKIHPAMQHYPTAADPLTHYHKGCGENGSVFCHANTWAIIAECMLGNAGRAYEYYRQLIPAVAMQTAGAWRYKAEPYAYASNIFGPESDRFGLANVSWLTGTAAWMYVAVTQYILGVRADYAGLVVAPCLPDEWQEAEVDRMFRGCMYHIHIRRTGTPGITVDGVALEGNIVPPQAKKECRVEVQV